MIWLLLKKKMSKWEDRHEKLPRQNIAQCNKEMKNMREVETWRIE